MKPNGMKQTTYLFACLLLALSAASCAKMGQPDGGWYDEEPPRIVSCRPADGAVEVKQKKVAIFFNEFIKVDNPTEKVTISPPQLEVPEIKTTGRGIVVQLLDSLKENTTYTIDFSDAITDNNEGNPLGNYTYSFSTGKEIDTMEVAGVVVRADDLEPVKGILVGLYAVEEADTCKDPFLCKPMLRVARTDGTGRFQIRGVRNGRYRVCALEDMDNDFHLSQRGEMLAALRDTITTSAFQDTRQDTLWRDSLHIDSIRQRKYTHFAPDNLVLRAYTQELTDRFFLKQTREKANAFSLFFSYGSEEFPKIKPLNFNARGIILESTMKRDTLVYWLPDSALINQDTLRLEMEYMATDTLGVLQIQRDTLEILSRQPMEKRLKQMEKERAEWLKKADKRRKKGEQVPNEMPKEALRVDYDIKNEPSPRNNIQISFPQPLAKIDTSKVHLYVMRDSLWYLSRYRLRECAGLQERTYHVLGDTLQKPLGRRFELRAEWREGLEYSFEVDSMAFTDIFGQVSDPYKKGFKILQNDEFSTMIVTLEGLDTVPKMVQLLDTNGKVMEEARAAGNNAEFFYLRPGTYYIRAFVDYNDNGLWDTGDYAKGLDAEPVFYYKEKVEAKAKWDITLTLRLTFPDWRHLKPQELVKQRAEQKRQIRNRNEERAKKLGLVYVPK